LLTWQLVINFYTSLLSWRYCESWNKTYIYHEVRCEHQIRGMLVIMIRECYYGPVNNEMHGENSAKACRHVLVPRVVIDTIFIYWKQAWQRIPMLELGSKLIFLMKGNIFRIDRANVLN